MPTLRPLDSDLWCVDHPEASGGPGLRLGTRTTVIRLSDGLWVHSPGALEEVAGPLRELGPVRHLVAPNLLHHTWLAEARALFPEATVWGAPGLRERVPGLPIDAVLEDRPPDAWSGEIDQHLVLGSPRLQEVVFLHRRSRTLVLTDLCFHVRQSDHLPTRWFMKVNGAYGRFTPSRIFKGLVVRDRARLRGSIDRILAWDFDRVTVTHGEVLEQGGRAQIREGFAWVV